MTMFRTFGLSLTAGVLAADLPAVVAWTQKVELGTLVSGVVAAVHVRPGQTVAGGDALVTLDDRGFKGEVSRHLAVYRHTQAALEEARREDERAIELYDRTVLSDFERNQAQIALQAARARAEEARADLIQARLDLERSVVRAPFDGMVLAVNVSPGQTIVSAWQSQPLVTLADHRVYHARAQVSLAQARELACQQSPATPVQHRYESVRDQPDEGACAEQRGQRPSAIIPEHRQGLFADRQPVAVIGRDRIDGYGGRQGGCRFAFLGGDELALGVGGQPQGLDGA